jgi:hypothetical protein
MSDLRIGYDSSGKLIVYSQEEARKSTVFNPTPAIKTADGSYKPSTPKEPTDREKHLKTIMEQGESGVYTEGGGTTVMKYEFQGKKQPEPKTEPKPSVAQQYTNLGLRYAVENKNIVLYTPEEMRMIAQRERKYRSVAQETVPSMLYGFTHPNVIWEYTSGVATGRKIEDVEKGVLERKVQWLKGTEGKNNNFIAQTTGEAGLLMIGGYAVGGALSVPVVGGAIVGLPSIFHGTYKLTEERIKGTLTPSKATEYLTEIGLGSLATYSSVVNVNNELQKINEWEVPRFKIKNQEVETINTIQGDKSGLGIEKSTTSSYGYEIGTKRPVRLLTTKEMTYLFQINKNKVITFQGSGGGSGVQTIGYFHESKGLERILNWVQGKNPLSYRIITADYTTTPVNFRGMSWEVGKVGNKIFSDVYIESFQGKLTKNMNLARATQRNYIGTGRIETLRVSPETVGLNYNDNAFLSRTKGIVGKEVLHNVGSSAFSKSGYYSLKNVVLVEGNSISFNVPDIELNIPKNAIGYKTQFLRNVITGSKIDVTHFEFSDKLMNNFKGFKLLPFTDGGVRTKLLINVITGSENVVTDGGVSGVSTSSNSEPFTLLEDPRTRTSINIKNALSVSPFTKTDNLYITQKPISKPNNIPSISIPIIKNDNISIGNVKNKTMQLSKEKSKLFEFQQKASISSNLLKLPSVKSSSLGLEEVSKSITSSMTSSILTTRPIQKSKTVRRSMTNPLSVFSLKSISNITKNQEEKIKDIGGSLNFGNMNYVFRNRKMFSRKKPKRIRKITTSLKLPTSDLFSRQKSLKTFGKASNVRSFRGIREFNRRMRKSGLFMTFPTAEMFKTKSKKKRRQKK